MEKKRERFQTKEGYVYSSLEEENQRLEELYALEILDSPKEEVFEKITETVAQIFGVPICFINLISEDRQWSKSCYGYESVPEAADRPRELSFCQYVVAEQCPLTTKDMKEMLGDRVNRFQPEFYAGAPLTTLNNHVIGTLCIMDKKSREFTADDQALLERFAQWTIAEIQLRGKRRITDRREQFMKAFFSITSDESTTTDAKIENLVALGCDYFGYASGGVAIIEPDTITLTPYYGLNKGNPTSQFPIKLAIFHELANQEEPLHYVKNEQKDTELYQMLRERFTFDELFGYHTVNKGKDMVDITISFIYLHTSVSDARMHPKDKDLMMILTQWIGQVFQRRLANAAIIASELRNRRVIEFANDAIILADENLFIQSWNPAAERIFQYKKDEAVGQKVDIIIPYHYLENHLAGVGRFIETRKGKMMGRTVELEGKKKDGHTFPIELSLYTWTSEKGLFFGCMIRDITERKRNEGLINELAYNDALTGLKNRTSFIERMDIYFKRKEPFGLLFIDIDGFKAVNDTFGHTTGDLLLQSIAERLHQILTMPGSDPYRYGGDEFLVVIEHPDQLRLSKIKKEIVESLSLPFYLKGDTIHVSASVGESIYPDNGKNLNNILKVADTYMYHMKQKGGGRALIAENQNLEKP